MHMRSRGAVPGTGQVREGEQLKGRRLRPTFESRASSIMISLGVGLVFSVVVGLVGARPARFPGRRFD